MKKKNTRSFLCITLVLVMLLSLAACAGSQNPTASSAATTTQSTGSTQPATTPEPTQSTTSPDPTEPEPDPGKSDDKGESIFYYGDFYQNSTQRLTETKMKESGSTYCDIIAGIDHSTVTIDGEMAYFTSALADGTPIRYVGKNITIDQNSITMGVDSYLASLDAIGKIYIYQPVVQGGHLGFYAPGKSLDFQYAYTFDSAVTSVDSIEQLHHYVCWNYEFGSLHSDSYLVGFQPNFVYLSSALGNTGELVLTQLYIGYNPEEKTTNLTSLSLNMDFYKGHLSGEQYRLSGEPEYSGEDLLFYLIAQVDIGVDKIPADLSNEVWYIPSDFYTIGDLKDADGNVLDKSTAQIYSGYTLEVIIDNQTFDVELPICERLEGTQTLSEINSYTTRSALGQQNFMIIPVVWADSTDLATDAQYAAYQKMLGRLIDETGNILYDLSDPNDGTFAVSEYFDIASYKQLSVRSFLTDWYYTDKTFEEYRNQFPEKEFADVLLDWVKATYPDTDWSKFDQNSDGYVDTIVIINVGLPSDDSYAPPSYGGGVFVTCTQTAEFAGTPNDPTVNCFISIGHLLLKENGASTLIHEMAHTFGLLDYYDTAYTGIDAVGSFDMQSSDVGDWNAYSKLAVGWMDPQIVENLASGEYVDISIGSSALVGDVILIPAAGTDYDGPFGEYIMIDLLTSDGVNKYDAAMYGLDGVVGVRISHVNANMVKTEQDGTTRYILHVGNYYESDDPHRYNIEVIQAGKVNTFTDFSNLDPRLDADDLFYAGDEFTAEAYSAFLEDGLMDDGTAFGYTVSILSIGTDASGAPTATIRITAK